MENEEEEGGEEVTGTERRSVVVEERHNHLLCLTLLSTPHRKEKIMEMGECSAHKTETQAALDTECYLPHKACSVSVTWSFCQNHHGPS